MTTETSPTPLDPAEPPLAHVLRVWSGSDGAATKGFYALLERQGPIGVVAVNLFRAQKNSARAKVYRRRGSRAAAYDTKQWAMDNLDEALRAHADALGLTWGWGTDETQGKHNVVLYVDLPTGQVSFHTDRRGEGPDYAGQWDGAREMSIDRICRWCARLLAAPAETQEETQ